MTVPRRIQRKRTKGYRLPPDAVYVGRPAQWGNLWKAGDPSPWGDHAPLDQVGAVEVFRYGWDTPQGRWLIRASLRGLDLACWCPLEDAHGNRTPCHADVLLEIANSEDIELANS